MPFSHFDQRTQIWDRNTRTELLSWVVELGVNSALASDERGRSGRYLHAGRDEKVKMNDDGRWPQRDHVARGWIDSKAFAKQTGTLKVTIRSEDTRILRFLQVSFQP